MEYTTSEVFLPARPRGALIPRIRLPGGHTEPVLADSGTYRLGARRADKFVEAGDLPVAGC